LILLDTNFLIAVLQPGSREDLQLQRWLNANEVVRTSIMVWAEFLCGPVTPEQIRTVAALTREPEPIRMEDTVRSAELFNATGRRRGSLADCLIAATCLRLDAAIATNNVEDFRRFMPFGLRVA